MFFLKHSNRREQINKSMYTVVARHCHCLNFNFQFDVKNICFFHYTLSRLKTQFKSHATEGWSYHCKSQTKAWNYWTKLERKDKIWLLKMWVWFCFHTCVYLAKNLPVAEGLTSLQHRPAAHTVSMSERS